MTASVFDSSITTSIANLVIASCWLFSLPQFRDVRLDARTTARVNNTQFLNSGVHLFFLLLSLVPYVAATPGVRLALATLCCLGFAVSTASADFYYPVLLRRRVSRWVAIVLLTTGGLALALSMQPIALLPMVLSVLLALMQFHKRLQALTELVEDNAVMREKISELSARVRVHRYFYHETNAKHQDRRAS